jgi:metal-responsive CopG/Arc/MetJ family transcriptional regulator
MQSQDPENGGSNVRPIRKIPRTPSIIFRLVPEDFNRFDMVCRLDGKTRTDVVRDAVRFYLEARENNLLQERDAKLEKQIKKGFDRLAAMQARANIDIGVLYNFAWNNLPKEKRGDILSTAYKHSVTRLKQRLTQDEQEVKDLIQK